MLFGLAELLNLEVPTILDLIRRNQNMMEKEYVSELPDARVRDSYTGSPTFQREFMHVIRSLTLALNMCREACYVVVTHMKRLPHKHMVFSLLRISSTGWLGIVLENLLPFRYLSALNV